MASQQTVQERREKVSSFLMHHVTSPLEIAKQLREQYPELDYETVRNDIRAIKKNTRPWLIGLAKDGYAFDAKLVIDKLKAQEKELESMKQETKDPKEKREIMRQIAETALARIQVEGDGPTFLAVTES